MGTHMRILSKSYLMNTNMTGFKCFSKNFASLYALDKSSISVGRVKNHLINPFTPGRYN